MILSGILHRSLGGLTVIRGVAPLGELARCSQFDPAYQRELIKSHKEEIERFLSERQFLFFPEVILSAPLNFDYNRARNRAVQPLIALQQFLHAARADAEACRQIIHSALAEIHQVARHRSRLAGKFHGRK